MAVNEKTKQSLQKLIAKTFYWSGSMLFVVVSTTAFVLKKTTDLPLTKSTQNIFLSLLCLSVILLCFGVLNFSVYFIRRRGLAPEEVKIPKKYYLLIAVFLALLGLSAI